MRPVDQAEIWRSVAVRGDPSRADAGLRRLPPRTGVRICRACDGDGLQLADVGGCLQPVKCGGCGGEGLRGDE